jgi:hypothetical protein
LRFRPLIFNRKLDLYFRIRGLQIKTPAV